MRAFVCLCDGSVLCSMAKTQFLVSSVRLTSDTTHSDQFTTCAPLLTSIILQMNMNRLTDIAMLCFLSLSSHLLPLSFDFFCFLFPRDFFGKPREQAKHVSVHFISRTKAIYPHSWYEIYRQNCTNVIGCHLGIVKLCFYVSKFLLK